MKFMRPDGGGNAANFRRDRTTAGGSQTQFGFGGGSGYSSRFGSGALFFMLFFFSYISNRVPATSVIFSF